VNKLILSLLAAGSVVLTQPAMAQNNAGAKQKPEAARSEPAGKSDSPHKVGLIDMNEVFQGYRKFETLRNRLQAEIEQSDAEAKAMLEKLQKLQVEIQEKKFTPGSPQFEQAEKQLLDGKAAFESFRAATQRKLARTESAMFKDIYFDTTKAVALYADYAKYTVVIRFDRKDIYDNTPPQEAVQRMNKQVVYYRASEDITDVVLNYLNKEYDKTSGSAKAPVSPASSGGANRSAVVPASGSSNQ